jgi:flagellar secretion chaperone FliS
MFSANASPTKQYQSMHIESAVSDAQPVTLVVMLFDGVIRNINEAVLATRAGNIQAKGQAIGKAIRILEEGLRASLDRKIGQFSNHLNDLYLYIGDKLLAAHLRNDVSLLDEALSLLTPIRDAWRSVEKRSPQ